MKPPFLLPLPQSLNPALSIPFLAGYFLLILVVPRLLARRIGNLKDYFLAGRQLTALPVALTFTAAWFGAASTMGSINAIHQTGLGGLWYVAIPSLCSFLVISTFIAGRVARQSAMSLPEAVEAHYGRTGRLLLAIVILASSNAFIASQMVAAGQVFEGVFGLNIVLATLASTAVVVTYSSLGGYFAVVVTDSLKITLVVLALLTLAIFTGVSAIGTLPHLPVFLASRPPGFFSFTGGDFLHNATLAFCFVIGWSIAPEMWQRMSSTKDEQSAVRASWLASGILMSLFALVTIIGIASTGVMQAAQAGVDKNILIGLALRMPYPLLALFVLIGFISAVTSSMDSGINVSSLTATRDLYQGFIRPNAGNRELLWVGRISTAIVVIPAMLIALKFQDIIQVLWIAADIYASTMFFPVIGLLYLKNPGRYSGILAMILGGGASILSALIQYGVIHVPFAWPAPPYSTLLGLTVSGIGFALGYWLSTRQTTPALSAVAEG